MIRIVKLDHSPMAYPDKFIAALEEAKGRTGIRLIHALTDLERIAASGATITGLRARAKG